MKVGNFFVSLILSIFLLLVKIRAPVEYELYADLELLMLDIMVTACLCAQKGTRRVLLLNTFREFTFSFCSLLSLCAQDQKNVYSERPMLLFQSLFTFKRNTKSSNTGLKYLTSMYLIIINVIFFMTSFN